MQYQGGKTRIATKIVEVIQREIPGWESKDFETDSKKNCGGGVR